MINILVGLITLVSAFLLVVRYGVRSKTGFLCVVLMGISGTLAVLGVASTTIFTSIIRIGMPMVMIALSKLQLKEDFNYYIEEALEAKRKKSVIVAPKKKKMPVLSRSDVSYKYNGSLAG